MPIDSRPFKIRLLDWDRLVRPKANSNKAEIHQLKIVLKRMGLSEEKMNEEIEKYLKSPLLPYLKNLPTTFITS